MGGLLGYSLRIPLYWGARGVGLGQGKTFPSFGAENVLQRCPALRKENQSFMSYTDWSLDVDTVGWEFPETSSSERSLSHMPMNLGKLCPNSAAGWDAAEPIPQHPAEPRKANRS